MAWIPAFFSRWILPLALLLAPAKAMAQESGSLGFGAGLGTTYYCIVSRCDIGVTLVGVSVYDLAPNLSIEGSARWHSCPDCDRFLIAEASLKLSHPSPTFAPFLAAGISVSSDPRFFGDEVGLHAGVGARLWRSRPWGVQVEVRGRQVGRGDHMGELSLVLMRATSN